MHDVTNQAKKHHERFAKEKTDLLRWYDMSGVKHENTKMAKKWQEKFVSTFSKSLIYFVSFMKELKERYLSRTTASLMYFSKFRMGRRRKK